MSDDPRLVVRRIQRDFVKLVKEELLCPSAASEAALGLSFVFVYPGARLAVIESQA